MSVYQGSHAINMDAKGRLAIPTSLRDSLTQACAGRLVITANTEERCLLVYPEPQWQQILPQIENLPSFNKVAARAKRLLIGYASAVEMDPANGRISIPGPLRKYASLEKELMLVGQGKKFELWSEESWTALLDEAVDDEVPPEMQSLSL
ncbi:division/cell wall cluster transcriptional repressor MraZ [Pseudoteredinibacter isoporae]|uniref:Transcriptional regulator MraZ n=1 Tax=Pseudoteredinibacter isoporae TaxID=570281 RepID=A0A7X0MWR1_9GAMM|nr:division/cell wall cluster transcriptional repressor MraZ [Pseudoteredinibacter isoporae]MBB6522738.1 MraZ protein [Pseudoteredinibacter isoporae]NHO88267.1 division/cell wall cluster transcriptional repressor MraZ [Pseudoteredinibacter isoporae]NIB23402.1 division/cell wall cluster transcriptional repressor MraZ [Pseudoteredinibacter isoporae]